MNEALTLVLAFVVAVCGAILWVAAARVVTLSAWGKAYFEVIGLACLIMSVWIAHFAGANL